MYIGKLSAETGFSKDTIRYYEKIGLIQSSGYVRQANNYKRYTRQTFHRLLNIRELKSAGFTLGEMTEMLDSFQQADYPCAEFPGKLADKLATIEKQIESLVKARRCIKNIVKSCNTQCTLSKDLPSCVRSS